MSSEVHGKTILIVGNEPDILNLIMRVLEEHRYSALTTSAAVNAIRTATELKGRINLLVADAMRPGTFVINEFLKTVHQIISSRPTGASL
jgi:CheY-like chemotaxis protein